jgi:hypothetical protein
MARKPSDDIRDAAYKLREKNQNGGVTSAWRAKPAVRKAPSGSDLNKDGFRIDWEEKHHGVGLTLYDAYTEGMTDKQKQVVLEAHRRQGLEPGNNGINRKDTPRRFHESSKFPGYEGAHQVTGRMGIDTPSEYKRFRSMSPLDKLNELDKFVENNVKHNKVALAKQFEQLQIEPGNNADTNVFGGNFSQQILQDRSKPQRATLKNHIKTDRVTRVGPPRALSSASAEILKIGKGLIGNVQKLFTKNTPKLKINRMPVGTGQMDEDLMTISEKLRIVPIEPYSMPRHLL